MPFLPTASSGASWHDFVKLPTDFTWDKLVIVSPEEMREKDLFPAGFFPLPHANHPEGGMTFPKFLETPTPR